MLSESGDWTLNQTLIIRVSDGQIANLKLESGELRIFLETENFKSSRISNKTNSRREKCSSASLARLKAN